MRDFPVSPKLLRTLAAQVGFDRFRLTERCVVESVLRVPRSSAIMPQPLGKITDVQGFLDWCTREGIDVEDQRPDPPAPVWADDWTVLHGA